jgi:hypothetical protein
LGLKGTDFVIGSDPGTERLADLVGVAHLCLIDFFLESLFLFGVW